MSIHYITLHPPQHKRDNVYYLGDAPNKSYLKKETPYSKMSPPHTTTRQDRTGHNRLKGFSREVLPFHLTGSFFLKFL